MKKILMISDSIYPDTMGGSHRHLYDLSRRLVNEYEVFTLTTNKDGLLRNQELKEKVNCNRFFRTSKSKIKGLVEFIINPYKTYKLMIKDGNEFDIIHGHWPLTTYLIFKFSKKNIRKIYTFHGPVYKELMIEKGNSFFRNIVYRFIKNIEKNVLKNSDCIIVASQYMKNQILDNYGDYNSKIKVIPVATDVKKFTAKYKDKDKAKKSLGLEKDVMYVFCLRRLQKRMGVENLIKAMKIVEENLINVKLLIGGKGEYKDELISIAQKYGIDNKIEFLGFIPEDKINNYYEAVNLVVMPSIDLEGFGLVTTEAMACGCKVIGTPVGGNKEILGNFNSGYVTESIAAEDIAISIIEVLKNDDIKKYSKQVREFVVENYSWEVILPQIIKTYEEQ